MREWRDRWCINWKIDMCDPGDGASEAFPRGGRNRAQGFAAFRSGGRLLRLCRLRMKRAFVLSWLRFRRDRGEGAVIRDREPRRNRNRDGKGTHPRSHPRFNRRCKRRAQIFSGGATAATLSGGTASATEAGGVGLAPNAGCSTRVDMSMAVKSSAPPTKNGAPGT
jgi:hypothetical protein